MHTVSCYGQQVGRTKRCSFKNLRTSSPQYQKHMHVFLGDFNACVGFRESNEQWPGVRDPHGYGVANDADKELLSFLSSGN